MKIYACILLFFLSSFCYSQIMPEEKLVLNDTLTFLGIDFSLMKFVNKEEYLDPFFIRDKHGAYWGGMDDAMVRDRDLKLDFGKKVVISTPLLFDRSYLNLDSTWIIQSYTGLSQTQMQERVKKYPTIPNSHLGLAFIVDRFEKDGRKSIVRMYALYIDLNNHTIIKTFDCTSFPGGVGYSQYWGAGITGAFKNFLGQNEAYTLALKRYFKKWQK